SFAHDLENVSMLSPARLVVAVTFVTVVAPAHRAMPQTSETPHLKPVGALATVNGVRMYYELASPDGPTLPPLVLLHGALSTIETDFGELRPRLSGTRQIIAIEQQGHGHTADVPDRALSYETMADDTAALLSQVGIRNADFFGYSMGGGISLQVA